MKEYKTESIRNIVLASHSSAGKTMLVEALANFTGITTRLGQIEDGTTIADYDDEEIRRGISLFTAVVPIEYKNTKLNMLDTPGYTDFIGEVISAMRVADGVLILVDSVAGLEVGTEMALQYSEQFNLPKMMLINKMERENANFQKALQSVQDHVEPRLLPLQLPWGEKADFKGVIDLLSMKAYAGEGKEGVEIPAEFKDQAEEAHLALVEAAAEGEDALLEKYFEEGDLSDQEIMRGLPPIKLGWLLCSTFWSISCPPLRMRLLPQQPHPKVRIFPLNPRMTDRWLLMYGRQQPILLWVSRPSSGFIPAQ